MCPSETLCQNLLRETPLISDQKGSNFNVINEFYWYDRTIVALDRDGYTYKRGRLGSAVQLQLSLLLLEPCRAEQRRFVPNKATVRAPVITISPDRRP